MKSNTNVKAIDVVKQMVADGQISQDVAEKYFPELKESEDEAHIDSLLKRLEGISKPGAAFISTRFAISEDKDWLKSLKDRIQPQQQKQWKPSGDFIDKACELLVNCIEDFMARRMEIWDAECKKQTLENLRKAMKGE